MHIKIYCKHKLSRSVWTTNDQGKLTGVKNRKEFKVGWAGLRSLVNMKWFMTDDLFDTSLRFSLVISYKLWISTTREVSLLILVNMCAYLLTYVCTYVRMYVRTYVCIFRNSLRWKSNPTHLPLIKGNVCSSGLKWNQELKNAPIKELPHNHSKQFNQKTHQNPLTLTGQATRI